MGQFWHLDHVFQLPDTNIAALRYQDIKGSADIFFLDLCIFNLECVSFDAIRSVANEQVAAI